METVEVQIGRRLQKARTAAGLSQAMVADALRIPRPAVSLLESGQRSLTSVELLALCRLYGKQASFFLSEPETQPAVWRFRAVSVEETDRAVFDEALDWYRNYAVLERAAFGSQHYELPIYPIPHGRAIDQGEFLARQERRRLGLFSSPVRSVVDHIEQQGVKVSVRPFLQNSQVSGGYFFSSELGPCVVINRNDPASRRRFTAAHEYGHFLADRSDSQSEVCEIGRRKELPEMRANAFAAAFLLPLDGIRNFLGDFGIERAGLEREHVVRLAQHFGASYEAVLWRLLNFRLITEKQHREMLSADWRNLARTLGYLGEPGLLESAPDRFRTVAIEAWRKSEISLDQLAELIQLPKRDLTKLLSGATQSKAAQAPAAEPDWF